VRVKQNLEGWLGEALEAHKARVERLKSQGATDTTQPIQTPHKSVSLAEQAENMILSGFPAHSVRFLLEYITSRRQLPVWDTPERLDQTVQAIGQGKTITILGPSGPGKTTLAACAVWMHFRKKPNGKEKYLPCAQFRYHRAFSLYTELSQSVYKAKLSQLIRSESTRELLVIDEFQTANHSPAATHALDEILDIRYSERRATLIISNLVPTEFNEFVRERNLSRWSEHGLRLILNCPDRRFPV